MGPMLRTPTDIATCPSKSDKWWFEKPTRLKHRDRPERPANLYACFPQPSRLSRCKLTISHLVFRHEFQCDQMQIPDTTFRCFFIYPCTTRHDSQLMMNFNQCVAFCIKKPNNCANFTLRGSALRDLHYKRLPRLSVQSLCAYAWMEWGSNMHNSVANSRTNSSPALWRPYFWNCPCSKSQYFLFDCNLQLPWTHDWTFKKGSYKYDGCK